jgi:hypothetical protein
MVAARCEADNSDLNSVSTPESLSCIAWETKLSLRFITVPATAMAETSAAPKSNVLNLLLMFILIMIGPCHRHGAIRHS